MLSISPAYSKRPTQKRQQSSDIDRLLLWTSSELANCQSQDIENVIKKSIADVCAIQGAEDAGWFLLADSGALTDALSYLPCSLPLHLIFKDGLQRLPWCLSRLKAGKTVLINDTDDLIPVAEADSGFLKAARIRSLALLPSNSALLGRSVFILFTRSSHAGWSEKTIQHCTLLENIFSSARQRRLTTDESQLHHLLATKEMTEQKNQEKREPIRKPNKVSSLASLLIQSQEKERKRISRELHDGIGQRLSLAASDLALLINQKPQSVAVLVGHLERLREELDGLCTDVHEMSHDLHSYKLQHLGLKVALKDLCRKLSQPTLQVDCYADDVEEPVSKDVSLCLYRVAQESINNALKHAQTSSVALTITKLNDTFYMTIQDLGVGFNHGTQSPGLGLVSMSERLKLVDGQFRLHSIQGRGTEIWVAVRDRPELLPSGPECGEIIA